MGEKAHISCLASLIKLNSTTETASSELISKQRCNCSKRDVGELIGIVHV